MKSLLIAAVAHEINRAYCASQGDMSQPAWADAPEWQRQSALAGVAMHIANPEATPEQSHESWLEQKRADGWTFGEVKDVEAKTHPCFRPYDELPPEQKAKDYLFRAVVHALKDMPDGSARAQPQTVVAIGGKVPVRYIGKREHYVDGTYGTRIAFVKGQTCLVPADKAALMFNHPDVYEPGSVEEAPAADPATAELDEAARKKAELEKQADEDQALRDSIATMDKKALASYAKTHFKVDLDQRKSVADLRTHVTGLVDQYGAA